MEARLVKDAGLSTRLQAAADAHPHCPPMNSGRLTWVRDELKRMFDRSVSVETVSKWFNGFSIPKAAVFPQLAQVLEVTPTWLQFGAENGPATTPETSKSYKARSEVGSGLVNVVAGLINLEGGMVAFGDEGSVDITTIINGKAYNLHVAQRDGDKVFVPSDYQGTTILAVERVDMGLRVAIVPPALIAEGTHHGGSIEVDVPEAVFTENQIESFRSLR